MIGYDDSTLLAPAEELSALLAALRAVGRGDASAQLPPHWRGLAGGVLRSRLCR